jgi:PKD repeat protein
MLVLAIVVLAMAAPVEGGNRNAVCSVTPAPVGQHGTVNVLAEGLTPAAEYLVWIAQKTQRTQYEIWTADSDGRIGFTRSADVFNPALVPGGAKLNVTSQGSAGKTSCAFTVVSNQTPVAIIDASPQSGPAPLTVTLDGSGSSDDGHIATYRWVLIGGAEKSGAQVTYTLAEPGSYTFKLFVYDNYGAVGVSTVAVIVE